MDGSSICFDGNIMSEFCGFDAIAFGVGLGKCRHTDKIVGTLLSGRAKLVLDADGLNTLNFENFDGNGKVIITPHPKEMSRLSGISVADVLSSPVEVAKNIAKKHNLVVLLKGSATVISDGDRVVINTFGTPAQAKGGSGDLLSGIIAGLLARGFDLFESAYIGAGIAGIAANLAVQKLNEFSVLPQDTALCVAEAVSKIIHW
jgi:NAD(P)H-hydrate epimerase